MTFVKDGDLSPELFASFFVSLKGDTLPSLSRFRNHSGDFLPVSETSFARVQPRLDFTSHNILTPLAIDASFFRRKAEKLADSHHSP